MSKEPIVDLSFVVVEITGGQRCEHRSDPNSTSHANIFAASLSSVKSGLASLVLRLETPKRCAAPRCGNDSEARFGWSDSYAQLRQKRSCEVSNLVKMCPPDRNNIVFNRKKGED